MASDFIQNARLNTIGATKSESNNIDELVEKVNTLLKKVKVLEKELGEVKTRYNDLVLWLKTSGVALPTGFYGIMSISNGTCIPTYALPLPMVFKKFLTKEQISNMIYSHSYRNNSNFFKDILPEDDPMSLYSKTK